MKANHITCWAEGEYTPSTEYIVDLERVRKLDTKEFLSCELK